MSRRRRCARRTSVYNFFSAIVVIGAFGVGAPSDARARGVVVSSASITAGAVGEQVSLPDGRLVDLRGLLVGPPLPPHREGQLLVHDFASGATSVASPDLALRTVIGRDGGTSTYLAALLAEPGDVVVYEATTRLDTDVLQAERFIRAAPMGGGGVYYADPGVPVPEAGGPAVVAVGLLALVGRARQRTRR